jgi:excisionase family DNA binding protein
MIEPSSRVLLTRRETARALGVSIDTLAQLIGSGELRTVRFGRAVRVPWAEMLALVERRLEGSAVALNLLARLHGQALKTVIHPALFTGSSPVARPGRAPTTTERRLLS